MTRRSPIIKAFTPLQNIVIAQVFDDILSQATSSKEFHAEDAEHLFRDDEGEDDHTYYDDDVNAPTPGRPDRKRARELDDDQEADEAEHEKVFGAQALEERQERQHDEHPYTKSIDELIVFRHHDKIVLPIIV
jgi:hypothetical protein